jgi:biotin synthase
MPKFDTAIGNELSQAAVRARQVQFGDSILFRGVIECTNICHHNCAYCGMRSANGALQRYALKAAGMMASARRAVKDGMTVIMLQAADHLLYDIDVLSQVIEYIISELQVSVLLCLGDRSLDNYRRLFKSGARQAILKFETSNPTLFRQLRPHCSLQDRLRLAGDLADIGYQMSSGFIQGLPGTNDDDLKRDVALLVDMPLFAASVSPFIPHPQTPLKDAAWPSLDDILATIARLRLARPSWLIPAVSALTLLSKREMNDDSGQLRGLMAGANVLTINYTPAPERGNYVIYKDDRWVVEREFAIRTATRAGLFADAAQKYFSNGSKDFDRCDDRHTGTK